MARLCRAGRAGSACAYARRCRRSRGSGWHAPPSNPEGLARAWLRSSFKLRLIHKSRPGPYRLISSRGESSQDRRPRPPPLAAPDGRRGGTTEEGEMSDDNCQARPNDIGDTCCDRAKPSRRGLLGFGAAFGGAVAGLLAKEAAAAGTSTTLERLKRAERDPGRRVLLKGGVVLSLDPQIGDFERGDVLIEGKKILAVGRDLTATALVVDAGGMIVMPGFVDTHHHQYETILRGILADGVLGTPGDGKKTYQGVIQGVFTPV